MAVVSILRFPLTTVGLSLSLLSSAVMAQAPFAVPRTVFGDPDLQGLWTNNTITPLERPAEFADRPVLSAEEARELERAVAEYAAAADQPSDPDRDAPTKGTIELADSYNNFWFDDGTEVAIYDGQYRSSLIIDPPNGRLPDYTDAARQRIEAERAVRAQYGEFDGPELRPLAERCLLSFGSSSGPPMLPILYNNHYQIVQAPGYVMILVEMVHDARIIRLDDTPLPSGWQPWMGDSRGHWEGDTLVVETQNFHPLQRFRNSSPGMRVTERFSRVGPDTLQYRFTVNDPDTFTQPFTGEIPLHRTQDQLFEYACHEGNYAMPGILAGARAEEADSD